MTRENKLALVVGFGLILFVGILISDHFSTVRSQTAANLTNMKQPLDPLVARQSTGPNLMDLQPAPPVTQQPVAVSPGTIENPPINPIADAARPEHYNGVYAGGYPGSPPNVAQSPQRFDEVRPIQADGSPQNVPGFVQAPTQPDPIPVNWKTHEVKSGESFYAICRQYYNDTNQVKLLAKFNSIDDPTSLRIGQKLRIPTIDELSGRPTAPPVPSVTPTQNPPASSPTPKPSNQQQLPPSLRVVNELQVAAKTNSAASSNSQSTTSSGLASTYTVKSGDSLASIAHKFLGSRNKWRKLYDMNRQVVADPNDVKVGTVLKLL